MGSNSHFASKEILPGDNSGGWNTQVTSLPYNTKFKTEEGLQYFRVIHDNQVKTCRICASVKKRECPQYMCRDCLKQGHYARNCKVPQCQGCDEAMLSCRCEKDEEENENTEMEIQEVMGATPVESLNDSQWQTQERKINSMIRKGRTTI